MNDATLWLGRTQREVSWAAFVAFVRNKLGGGHFDPDDRKRWQEELAALTTETKVDGEEWLGVKMLTLARALRFGVESSGFMSLTKFDL